MNRTTTHDVSDESLATHLNEHRSHRTRITFAELGFQLNKKRAYKIARESVDILGQEITAWKLGGTTAFTRALFQTDGVYFGPLVEGEVFTAASDAPLPDLPVLAGEAEVVLRLSDTGASAPPDAKLEPTEAFESWAAGVEFPYSCFQDLPEAGLGALLADRCATGALVLGPELAGVPPLHFSIAIALSDGREAKGGHDSLLMSPVEAALEFRRLALGAGFKLHPGQWVSTGGATACMLLDGARQLQLNFDGETVFTLGAVGG